MSCISLPEKFLKGLRPDQLEAKNMGHGNVGRDRGRDGDQGVSGESTLHMPPVIQAPASHLAFQHPNKSQPLNFQAFSRTRHGDSPEVKATTTPTARANAMYNTLTAFLLQGVWSFLRDPPSTSCRSDVICKAYVRITITLLLYYVEHNWNVTEAVVDI